MMEQDNQLKNRKSLYQNRLAQVLLLIVICLIVGLIDGFRSYVGTYHNGIFFGYFYGIMRWDVSGWLIWVALIPFVLWLCNRYPLDRNSLQKLLLIFIPVGIFIALARAFFPALVHILFFEGLADLQRWLPNKFYILISDFVIAFSFYLLVLTFGQARNYYKRFREEELRTSQLELQLSKAQLQALKAQLHPHFLFNALNSISALQTENPEEAQKMIARLGDFLRMTLENVGVQEVSLEREIEFLKCYLDIEKVRFGNRLSTNIRIAPEVQSVLVPNLILQPLVENAVRHGIAPQATNGRIDITANRDNGWLKVKIKDNGRGINGKNMDEIFSTGVGLSNTRARLNQLYGKDFRFDLESGNGHGLLITLCVPAKTECVS